MTATVYRTPDEALDGIVDGARVMVGGFVSAGTPSNLILALKRRGTRDITLIANNIGFGDKLDELCEGRQVTRAIATFAVRASSARESHFEAQYRRGEVELELVPQGTFAERIRAGGAGIGGFLTRTGAGTQVAAGKETVTWAGEEWLLERPLRADVALLKAHRADRLGNLSYRLAGQNFNPVMATAADLVIAEVEEIVETGAIAPEAVDTPAVYIDRLVRCDPLEVRWDGR